MDESVAILGTQTVLKESLVFQPENRGSCWECGQNLLQGARQTSCCRTSGVLILLGIWDRIVLAGQPGEGDSNGSRERG